MIKRPLIAVLMVLTLFGTSAVMADPISVAKDDDIATVLTGQIGKKVTIRTNSGHELSGTVTAVTGRLTHLSELTGKEFYDAVISNSSIDVVIIRTK
jgi:hypothetical protein